MSRRRHNAEEPGQDSFLDIVANLVGILLILIMVVGVGAKDALLDVAPIKDESPQAEADLAAAEKGAAGLETDLERLTARAKRAQFEVSYRRAERDKLHQIVTAAERQVASETDELDAASRKTFEAETRLASIRRELEDIRLTTHRLLAESTPRKTIEHLPTPMAKTVFGSELHLRLLNGRIAHVPWEQLVEKLKDEAPEKAWKLKQTESITETIGPVAGFRLRYTLTQKQRSMQTKIGPAVARTIELDRFVLVPMSETLGEPVDRALQAGSELERILKRYNPSQTTVTVWVYPDSFAEFRRLKERLYKEGFLCAGRPLPEGHPIGGSPQGSRSVAQ